MNQGMFQVIEIEYTHVAKFKQTRSQNIVVVKIMTISERIFERLRQLSMTQKEFAEAAGIQQSTISEWKKNKTNPSSDKILAICKALDVSPEWLLSGVDPAASRTRNHEYYIINVGTDTGILVEEFNKLEKEQRDRILGYVAAFVSMQEEMKKK